MADNQNKQIVWNTVDAHMDVLDLRLSDVSHTENEDGSFTTYSQKESFNSFDVCEVAESDLVFDEDGDVICDDLYLVKGKWYRTLQTVLLTR